MPSLQAAQLVVALPLAILLLATSLVLSCVCQQLKRSRGGSLLPADYSDSAAVVRTQSLERIDPQRNEPQAMCAAFY